MCVCKNQNVLKLINLQKMDGNNDVNEQAIIKEIKKEPSELPSDSGKKFKKNYFILYNIN